MKIIPHSPLEPGSLSKWFAGSIVIAYAVISLIPLVWISFAVASFIAVQTVTSNLNLPVSQVLLSDIAPLILLTGPALVVISTLLSRSATARRT